MASSFFIKPSFFIKLRSWLEILDLSQSRSSAAIADSGVLWREGLRGCIAPPTTTDPILGILSRGHCRPRHATVAVAGGSASPAPPGGPSLSSSSSPTSSSSLSKSLVPGQGRGAGRRLVGGGAILLLFFFLPSSEEVKSSRRAIVVALLLRFPVKEAEVALPSVEDLSSSDQMEKSWLDSSPSAMARRMLAAWASCGSHSGVGSQRGEDWIEGLDAAEEEEEEVMVAEEGFLEVRVQRGEEGNCSMRLNKGDEDLIVEQFRGRGAGVKSCREVERARRHHGEYCNGSALPRHDPSKETDGFDIIITKTRGACVTTRFWPNQEVGRKLAAVLQTSALGGPTLSTRIEAPVDIKPPRYPVEDVKEMKECHLHYPIGNMSMKVAIGSALPCLPGALHHNNPIQDGYARVTVEDIVPGFEDLEIDYATPEGERRLGVSSASSFYGKEVYQVSRRGAKANKSTPLRWWWRRWWWWFTYTSFTSADAASQSTTSGG
ncbi:hypothetical protein QYE76_049676 [Lolium multiflorum]|uniref:DUF8039 domain-containing protein n=1 Tax=Lolium multiflorum TaxID=4521 RepID=A0AAD8SQ39_LOLMU|nr:hypothetical protein QYE76_049676 [Lolium multiflorum]